MSETSTFTDKQKKMWAALLAGRTVKLLDAKGNPFSATWKHHGGTHYLRIVKAGQRRAAAGPFMSRSELWSYVANFPDADIGGGSSGRRRQGQRAAARRAEVPLDVLESRLSRLSALVRSRGGNVDCGPAGRAVAPPKTAAGRRAQAAPVIVNPGSGPVEGTSLRAAAVTIRRFVTDLRLKGVTVTRKPSLDGDGRFGFVLRHGGRETEIEMPGLPVKQVRYVSDKQNIWDYPRLYVDGSSWVWRYALNSAREALKGS